MAGLFDDLPQARAPQGAGLFDDLPEDLAGQFRTAPPTAKRKVGMFESFDRSAAGEYAKTGRLLGLAASAPVLALDKIVEAITGSNPRYGDKAFEYLVDPAQNAVEYWGQKPDEEFNPVGAAGGTVSAILPQVLAQPGKAIVPITEKLLPRVIPQAAEGAIKAQVPMALPGAADTYTRATQAGATDEQAAGAALSDWEFMTGAGMLPAAVPGNWITRALTGAGINVGSSVPQEMARNEILADVPSMQSDPFDITNMTTQGGLGALFGIAMGGRGRPARPAPAPPPDTSAADAAAQAEAYAKYAPILQANGVAPDDPRAPQLIAMLDARAQKQAEAQAAQVAAMSPEERAIAEGQKPPETIVVAPAPSRTAQAGRDAARAPIVADLSTVERLLETGQHTPAQRAYLERRAIELRSQLAAVDEPLPPDAGPAEMDGTRAGALSAGGAIVNRDKRARDAFEISGATLDPREPMAGQRGRKQEAADAQGMTGEPRDLRDASAGGTTTAEGSAATAEERFMFLDVQRDKRGNVTGTGPQVTVINDGLSMTRGKNEVPAAEISYEAPDGSMVTEIVPLARLTELSRPANPRFAQDAAAQSYSPPKGAGTGDQQPAPRTAAQRITTSPPASLERAPRPVPDVEPPRQPNEMDGESTRVPEEPAPRLLEDRSRGLPDNGQRTPLLTNDRLKIEGPEGPAGLLPGPDSELPGGRTMVDRGGEARPETYGDQQPRDPGEPYKRPARGPEPLVGEQPPPRPVETPQSEKVAKLADRVQQLETALRKAEDVPAFARTAEQRMRVERLTRARDAARAQFEAAVRPAGDAEAPRPVEVPPSGRQPRESVKFGNDAAAPKGMDPAKAQRRALERVEVEVEVREAESGKTYKVKTSAAEAVADVDSRLEKAKALWECLHA